MTINFPGLAEDFDPDAYFGADGALAQVVSDYLPRTQQHDMAEAVWTTMVDHRMLVVEASTGVGKTFAYLAPALLSRRKTLISTGTRHLQDQLYQKDLPTVLKALGQSREISLLKGRANYLCRYRMQAYVSNRLGPKTEQAQILSEWERSTRSGDIMELDCADNDPMIPAITSTADNCLGRKCPDYDECFVARARRKAQEADLVVVNHHLFAADLALREDSLGELLPPFETMIFDEAHRVADVLEQSMGRRVGTAQVQQLCRDAETLGDRQAEDVGMIRTMISQLRRIVKQTVGQVHGLLGRAKFGDKLPPIENFNELTKPLCAALEELAGTLQVPGDEVPELANLAERSRRLSQDLAAWPCGEAEWCEFLTATRNNFQLHQVPISISKTFALARKRYDSDWVFTSATLSVAGNFDYFNQRLGLDEDVTTLQLDSPFNFKKQTRLYLPQDLPDPHTPDYTPALMQAVLPLLEQLRGRTFLLFTSLRAVDQADQWLQSRTNCTRLKQGNTPRNQLLEQFLACDDAILLGSASFWEGVDIRGPALSCVIIDKIPFAPHTDLLVEARIKAIKEQGGNPFLRWQLPQAALMLKQGVGRLVRSVTDHGVVVIADPRLLNKHYGRSLLDSLPEMPVSTDLEQTLDFLREHVA